MDHPIFRRSRTVADLYADHHVFVWRCLRRLGVASADLDDAVQDVFIVVHRKWGSFEGRSSERLWLYAIVRRVAADHRRSRGRRHRREEAMATHARAVGPLRPERRADALLLLDQFLDQLPPRLRETFVLFEVEGFSGAEVAEATRANVNTAYARRRAARQAFVALLGDDEPTRHAIGKASRRDRPSRKQAQRLAGLVGPILVGTGIAGWGRRALASSSVRHGTVAGSGQAAAGHGGLLLALKAAAVTVSLAGVVTAGALTVDSERHPPAVTDRPAAPQAATEGPLPASREPAMPILAPRPPQGPVPVQMPSAMARPTPDAESPRLRTASSPPSAQTDATPEPGSNATLKAELALQQRARAALARGRPLTALNLIDTYEHQYPDGTFAPFMAALRVDCLCALGKTDQARTEARLFVLEHPSHPATRHVRKVCR